MLKAKSLVLASLMSILFVAGEAAAELKVGYVNTQRIFRDAPAAQKAGKKLEGEFAKRDQELQKMAKQLQGLQENLEKEFGDHGGNRTSRQGKGIRRTVA